MSDPMAATAGYAPAGPVDPLAAQIAAFLSANPAWQALATAPITETRAAFREATPVLGEPVLDHVEDARVPVSGGEILVRLYRPTPHPHAILVWAHGGGFAMGSADEIDNFARLLARETQCLVASVEYRLAPEHRFPVPLEDLEAAIHWVQDRATDLVRQDVPIFVGGDSAGANLATVATRRLHASGTASITGNILAYPCTDSGDAASLLRFTPPFLTVAEVRFFLDGYQPERARQADPDFAPLRANDLHLLPPTLLLTAEHDIITEQAEEYGRAVTSAGVAVQTIRYPGMIHGFLTLDPFFAGAAGEAIGAIAAFVADTSGPA